MASILMRRPQIYSGVADMLEEVLKIAGDW
jgi:hypothetical protein